jgi:hypothetical protein
MARVTKEWRPGDKPSKPMRPGKPPLMVDPYPGKPMRPKPKPDPRPGIALPGKYDGGSIRLPGGGGINEYLKPSFKSRTGSGITGPAGRSVNKIYNTY